MGMGAGGPGGGGGAARGGQINFFFLIYCRFAGNKIFFERLLYFTRIQI